MSFCVFIACIALKVLKLTIALGLRKCCTKSSPSVYIIVVIVTIPQSKPSCRKSCFDSRPRRPGNHVLFLSPVALVLGYRPPRHVLHPPCRVGCHAELGHIPRQLSSSHLSRAHLPSFSTAWWTSDSGRKRVGDSTSVAALRTTCTHIPF